MPPLSLNFSSKVFEVETIELQGHQGADRQGRPPPVPAAAQGVRGHQADRRHRLGLAGPGAGPEPARIAGRHRHQGEGRPAAGLDVGGAGAPRPASPRQNGTLGEMFEVVKESDLVLLLISDAAQAELFGKVFEAIRPGATLGLSHGFLLGHMKNVGAKFPANINVIARLPQGHGPVGAAAVRAGQVGQRRRHQRQLRRRAGHRRPGDRHRPRLVGGARLALHLPDHARVRVQVRHLRRARHPAGRGPRHHREPVPPLQVARA